MRVSFYPFILVSILTIFSCSNKQFWPPLNLHPENPHYFLFRGKPAVLIGSTEHYGAVMNLDFDYIRYFNELSVSDLNVTRTFSGVYVEPPGAFNIEKNTLAPAPGKYICPWKRSDIPGYALEGNKFDLTKWDENYFRRLKDFITEAGKRNIVVELDLFSNFYDTLKWELSPLYIGNNINNIGNTKNYKEILALRHPEILTVQENMVRKIVSELRDFDNLYYEVCNEPYFGDTIALNAWEKRMTDVIVDAEINFKNKHLISQNIANHYKFIVSPHPGVSIYNFHYAKPPVAVAYNYHLNKPIGDNETGFNGIADAAYRTEAWDFMLAGGALFNHLDYSFTTENEDGSHIIKKGQPGGGGKILRNQLHILHDFLDSIDYIHMAPDTGFIRILKPDGSTVQTLSKKDDTYVCYFKNFRIKKDTDSEQKVSTVTEIEADLPRGTYKLFWLDTKNGKIDISQLNKIQEGRVRISTPAYMQDIALKIVELK